MFVGKFMIYEFWIFSGKSRVRPALRSRRDVWLHGRAETSPETERAA
jgi:hypothetical protein